MAQRRVRADALVVALGLADTRTRAQALIGLGVVLDARTGHHVDKAGTFLSPDTTLRLRHQPLPYVSRAAGKLQGALDAFGIDVRGLPCLDVGASTGGFTDLLLHRGAAHVTAVDVGTNQLVYKLRQDPRVTVREQCHVVHAPDDTVAFGQAFVCVDVSFISLTRVVPALGRWLKLGATAVFLVKPQFEVGPANVGKGGIVTDHAARSAALLRVQAAVQAAHFAVRGAMASPVLGSKGNQEYLLVASFAEPDRCK